jgi:hypothetical protein
VELAFLMVVLGAVFGMSLGNVLSLRALLLAT